MARSVGRRPGFSRRAQYGIFTGYVIAVAGVVLGAILLIVSLVNPGSVQWIAQRGRRDRASGRRSGCGGAGCRPEPVRGDWRIFRAPAARTPRSAEKLPPRAPMP